MRLFRDISELDHDFPVSSVAIGNFDGVHLGHSALLSNTVRHAAETGSVPAVLTFDPHPSEVIHPERKIEKLTTLSEKAAIFEKLGIGHLLIQKFDMALATMSPEDFIEQFLLRGFKTASLHVGFNFHFGKDRRGNPSLLGHLCELHRIKLVVQAPYEIDGKRLSSSLVRHELKGGNVRDVSQLLGRSYSVEGEVTHGRQVGKGIGFPTANLDIPPEKILPKNGVYLTRAFLEGRAYKSVANVGVRPTVSTQTKAIVEAHLLDFDSDLYGKTLKLEFVDRIREERKFDSMDQLKKQIAKDVALAKMLNLSSG